MDGKEKTSKIKEIRDTVSGVAEITRQIGMLGITESLGKIMNAVFNAKEIIEMLRTPEMVKNIDNCRLISENMKEVSTQMKDIMKQLEETGVINEAKGLIRSAKYTTDSFCDSSQDLHEMSVSFKEMFNSIRDLIDNLRMITA